MKYSPLALIGAAAFALLSLLSPHDGQAQALKGANWLRFEHNYSEVPANDPRRVGWNLEMALDMPNLASPNYRDLYTNHGVRTLARLAFSIRPTATEIAALHAASFSCTSIAGLMNRLDAEANNIPSHDSIAAFILANEPNLDSEWNLSGVGYGRAYQCYRQRWSSNPAHGAKPLLASGPGGCHIEDCPGFYRDMSANIGSVVDGFAIHAYGATGQAFATDMGGQLSLLNSAGNAAVRNKPVYVTEFNAGAREWTLISPTPTLGYFNDVLTAVRDHNAANAGQVKALLYFVDSPDSWTRREQQCHPFATPTGTWALASLCYNADWRRAWLDSRYSAQSLDASLSFAGLPAFMMPGQIQRFDTDALNTGGTTWDGGGAASWFRLGAHTGNGFMFSHFPQCGGYANSIADARIYTCAAVASGAARQYRVQARAPIFASNATFSVRMVRDGVTWFGSSAQQNVMIGQTSCGSAVNQCILRMRPDVLPFYQSNGWDTSCSNRNAIVNNWCGQVDSDGSCAALKAGACATFNSTVRCPAFTQIGGAAIARSDTFPGYKICGTDARMYTCGVDGVWAASTTPCK